MAASPLLTTSVNVLGCSGMGTIKTLSLVYPAVPPFCPMPVPSVVAPVRFSPVASVGRPHPCSRALDMLKNSSSMDSKKLLMSSKIVGLHGPGLIREEEEPHLKLLASSESAGAPGPGLVGEEEPHSHLLSSVKSVGASGPESRSLRKISRRKSNVLRLAPVLVGVDPRPLAFGRDVASVTTPVVAVPVLGAAPVVRDKPCRASVSFASSRSLVSVCLVDPSLLYHGAVVKAGSRFQSKRWWRDRRGSGAQVSAAESCVLRREGLERRRAVAAAARVQPIVPVVESRSCVPLPPPVFPVVGKVGTPVPSPVVPPDKAPPDRRGDGYIPMLPSVRRRWKALATTCVLDDGSTPISVLIAKMPWAHPARFHELVQLSIDTLVEHFPCEGLITGDFDPVAMFREFDGADCMNNDTALYLFRQLFVGSGRFPSLFEGDRSVTLVGKNQRKLVVQAAVDPYPVELPLHPLSQKRRHLGCVLGEIEEGRAEGPFTTAEAAAMFGNFSVVQSFVLSRPTAVSSKDRLVHNFSDFFNPINMSLEESVMLPVALDHSAKFIAAAKSLAKRLAVPLSMVTLDISKGYRRLLHRRQDVAHLGLRVDIDFDGEIPFCSGSVVSTRTVKKGDVLFVMDRSLPFGLKSSVTSFCALTSFVKDFVQESLGQDMAVLTYVDDFGLIGSVGDVERGIVFLRDVLARIGLPENAKKADTPGPRGTFLGVDYDFSVPERMTAALPMEKRVRYLKHLNFYLASATPDASGALSLSVSKTELQSIIGKIVHASYIIDAGRPFYARLLATLRKCNKRVRLDAAALDDLRWWVSILEDTSGVRVLNPVFDDVKFYTDASTTTGYGAIFNGQFFFGQWPQEVQDLLVDFSLTINELELVVLSFALEQWGPLLEGSRVIFRCDNTSSVYSVLNQTSRVPVRAALVRRLYAVAAKFGVSLHSTYINTKDNLHADTLSRGNMHDFFLLDQRYPLCQIHEPKLGAMELLLDPFGSANPSSPEWKLPAC